MPSSDPVKRKAVQDRWKKENMKRGYGKYLYARRKLVYEDAGEFKIALELIASGDTETVEAAKLLASRALRDSAKRHEALPSWRAIIAKEQVFKGGGGP